LLLPERYREPMLLRHVRDLSYQEIASILGISENAVQVRIFRARQMLRESL
jgi:RNA polymerase sigma-70 factor (ECF subfamily)